MFKSVFQLRTLLGLALCLGLASAGAATPTPVTVGGENVAVTLGGPALDALVRFEAASAGVHWVSVTENAINQKMVVDVYQGEVAARQGVAQYIHTSPQGDFLFGVELQPGVHYLRFWTQGARGGIKVGVSKAAEGVTAPAIETFRINSGATTANQTAVTLNSVASGAPATFLAYESWLTSKDWPLIAKTSWAPYLAKLAYRLSPANGAKSVRLVVKNAEGVLSKPATDSINLLRILPLTANRGYEAGEFTPPDYKEYYWYQFTVRSESNYAITANPDIVAGLYGPDDRKRLITEQTISPDDSLARRLKRGTYYIRVQAGRPPETNGDEEIKNFSISVMESPGVLLKRVAIKNVFSRDNALRPLVVERRLTIASEVLGEPKEYQIATTPRFQGVSWQRYAPEVTHQVRPYDFGYFYFRVRDAKKRISPAVRLWYNLSEAQPLTLDKSASFGRDQWLQNIFAIKVTKSGEYLFELNMDGCDDPTWTVNLKLFDSSRPARLVTGRTFHYPPFTGWKDYPTTMSARLGARLTPGTYYLELDQRSFATMTLKVSRLSGAPILTDFRINSGETYEYTTLREVTLNSAALGDPKEIIVSTTSTFAGARWRPYAKAVRFTLPEGNGRVAVYAKVRGKAGVSPVYSDTIELSEPLPLTVDGGDHAGEVKLAIPDYYTFTVATAGEYSVETAGSDAPNGTTTEFRVFNYRMKRLRPTAAKVPKVNALRHTFDLTPGVYMIEVPARIYMPLPNDTTSYSYTIKVVSGE